MARPQPLPSPDEQLIVLDGITPVRIGMGTWSAGADRTAVVILSTTQDAGGRIHPTLGGLCLADARGTLTLELDPMAALLNLETVAHLPLWGVALLSDAERAAAGDAWSPVRVRALRVSAR